MHVRIYHNDKPMSLSGGYQGMFASITMIERLSILVGLSKYILSITMTGRHRSLGGGGLSRALEFRPLLCMIDRHRLLGWISKHIRIYHNDGPISLVGGVI